MCCTEGFSYTFHLISLGDWPGACAFALLSVSSESLYPSKLLQMRTTEHLLGRRRYTFKNQHLSPPSPSITKTRRETKLTADTSVVLLNMHLPYFPVFDHESVSLAALVAEDGLAVEGQVEGRGEGAVRVGEEADAGFGGGVEGGCPGFHAVLDGQGGFEVRYGCGQLKGLRNGSQRERGCKGSGG